MKIGSNGLNLIKQFEGCKLKAYRCPAGIWTIGYGHTGREVAPQMVISQEQADELLRADVSKFETQINSLAETDHVRLTQNQFDALVCFAYNVGFGNLKKSTLWAMLREHQNPAVVADQFNRWTKAGGVVLAGLVKRRAAERELFLQA